MPSTHSKRRPTITAQMKLDVLRFRAVVKCEKCGDRYFLNNFEFDHHLALIDGGEHSVANLRPLCRTCHKLKSVWEHKENCRAKRRAKKHAGDHQSKRPMTKRVNPWAGHKAAYARFKELKAEAKRKAKELRGQ